ncbi:hypothetical protein LWI28_018238 [Acer negundo]|uniref:Uncharacterized protein n=1 Tax=Acer negundo TaxID=4023 RepID=A0AAD5NV01_ACENE|nr:hypothetical protein LWI28_018238 [Acer negundo]
MISTNGEDLISHTTEGSPPVMKKIVIISSTWDIGVRDPIANEMLIPSKRRSRVSFAKDLISSAYVIKILHCRWNAEQCRFIRESAMKILWLESKIVEYGGKGDTYEIYNICSTYVYNAITILPQKVCDKLDRMNRNFLWGSTNEKGKVRLVGWHHNTKSRLRCGLSIQSVRRCKIAMLGKLDWALNHGKERL